MRVLTSSQIVATSPDVGLSGSMCDVSHTLLRCLQLVRSPVVRPPVAAEGL